MVNYIDSSEVMNTRQPTWQEFHKKEDISSIDIHQFLKTIGTEPNTDWNPTKIDEALIEWLEGNAEGSWELDMCEEFIHLANNKDSWKFLEWLEEYEAGD